MRKLSWLLVCGIVAASMSGAMSSALRADSAGNATASWSCDYPSSIPSAQRCQFLRDRCETESRIPYALWYYCGASQHGGFVAFLYVVAVLCVLPLLFTLLGDTAEMYFSPIMAHISQTVPKMRPRFAGVTFVALGNGAPDLSSNISAIRNGEYLLSAGALTGAAMFVQCIVGSEVIRISHGVRCRGAMLRDIAIYLVSISIVLLFFWLGIVNRVFVALAVTLYLVYAIWVFCGDEWHARGRPRLTVAGSMARLKEVFWRRRGDQMVDQFEEGLLPWADVEVEGSPRNAFSTPLQPLSIALPEDRADMGEGSARFALVGARQYQQAVWADLEGDDMDTDAESTSSFPAAPLREYRPPRPTSPGTPAQYHELTSPRSTASTPQPLFPGVVNLHLPSALVGAWPAVKDELTMGQASEWAVAGPLAARFRAVTFPLLLPAYLAQRMTIPFADPDSYNHQWLVVAALCSPLWGVLYLQAFTVTAVVVAAVVGFVLAGVVFWLTEGTQQLPPVMVGRVAVAPAVVALSGFVVGVTWIDALASEVVGVLTFLAGLCNFPAGVLGMTVLAWGNSLGDFFGNKAMARQGHASMALTACFASPLFNMLVSMALGFGAKFAVSGRPWERVQLTPEVALGCGFLVVYNVAVALTGLAHRGRIPAGFFRFARVWYGLYFVLASGFGLLGHYGKL